MEIGEGHVAGVQKNSALESVDVSVFNNLDYKEMKAIPKWQLHD